MSTPPIRLLGRRLALAVRRDPEFLRALAADCGDVVRLRLPGRELLLLSRPAAVGELLQDSSLLRGGAHAQARARFGSMLQCLDGPEHEARRGPIAAALRPSHLGGLLDGQAGWAECFLDGWSDGDVRDIDDEMRRLCLGLIVIALGGSPEAGLEDLDAGLAGMSRTFGRRPLHNAAWLACLPVGPRRRSAGVQAALEAWVAQLAEAAPESGIAAHLAELHAGLEPTARREVLRDALRGLLFGGRETIAAGLTWALFLAGCDPEIAARLAAEADACGRLNADALPRLRYARALLAESLRLYPPAWAVVRHVPEARCYGGVHVAAGSLVITSQYVVQRDPRLFPDTERCDPERWLTPGTQRPGSGRYFPFGGGGFRCPGEALALSEGALVLAAVARRWRLAPLGARPPALDAGTALRPSGGLRMRVIRR